MRKRVRRAHQVRGHHHYVIDAHDIEREIAI
jgi:hypothetical protein